MERRNTRTLVADARQQLLALYSAEDARAIAYALCCWLQGVELPALLVRIDEEWSPLRAVKLQIALRRMLRGEPLQYIMGYTEFYGCRIEVNSSVLIPRVETEELTALIVENTPKLAHLTIIDVGTGSGCIAIALAKHLPLAQVYGWDISEQAIQLAKRNATSNGVLVNFKKMDVLQKSSKMQADIIVSNPPYIPRSERIGLPLPVRCEPERALFVPNADPLQYYRRIACRSMHTLRPEGRLFLELNPDYAEDIVDLLDSIGLNSTIHYDLCGRQRMLEAVRK